MATCFDNLNGKKLVIGLVHLVPMLGTPLYQDGNLDKMTKKAIEDCLTLKKNGADGGLIQTVDVYYPSTDDTDYARVAGLAAVTARVRDAVGDDFLVGAQIMWNCITPSLAVCKTAGAVFTRCTALAGNTESMFGMIEANPLKVAEYRRKIEAMDIGMLAEISGYHHVGEYSSENVKSLARTSMHLGANAVEVCSRDFEQNERLVKDVKAAGNIPVILGGGTDADNCKDRLRYADGALVGTAFEGGKWGGPIIGSIVSDYVRNVRALEEELAAR
ncbi:BtpA/SgcQ family protein [Bacillota bacterium Meth-B3]|nr:BtpA/SgcQ family protein [Christensenellaceae bacterium]MEA5067290.1 BtpA/SgcQ family protein [Eubacteriales bacterium]MEA5068431.1 BtpA/SgcQ family protein [Christensenellaceae bacterium]